jgi:cytochrome c biogenesis protein CcmG/thiol:disulfide interchange protein DsbE
MTSRAESIGALRGAITHWEGPNLPVVRLLPTLAIIAVIGVIALLGFGLAANNETDLAVGEEAPALEADRLDGSGPGSLADYAGDWVLLNFWASWCEPCRTESPAIETWAEEQGDAVTVVGMNTEDLTGDAEAFIDEFGLTWEMLRDGEGTKREEFGVYALPETFLIDPQGKIALIRRGTVDEAFLDEEVTPLIEGEGAGA